MNRHIILICAVFTSLALTVAANPALGAVAFYGDQDVLGVGTYPGDPTTGATLEGLAPDAVTFGAAPLPHTFPFAPDVGDYPGTDQIYVGSVQTGGHDGYSGSAQRINGPQVITMDYSSLVPAGQTVASLTLGIAADDFQFPVFGQPYTALINGSAAPALTAVLNQVDQTTPVVQFFTIGISPSALAANHVLTLSIDQGGDGGDGWAVDFLSVGIVTVPEPASLLLAGLSVLGILTSRRKSQRR